MCRGLAVGYNPTTGKVICIGDTHHTKTLGDQEDDCIKLEIIITDKNDRGFKICLDENTSKDTRDKFPKYITKASTISKNLNNVLEDCKDQRAMIKAKQVITIEDWVAQQVI